MTEIRIFTFKVEQVMTSRGLSQENLRDMKSLFDLFDIDGDGSISLNELETVMKTLGHCPPRSVNKFHLTRRLAGFEILNNATLIFQKLFVSRHFANIFHYLNFSEEYL